MALRAQTPAAALCSCLAAIPSQPFPPDFVRLSKRWQAIHGISNAEMPCDGFRSNEE
jgi:hypothetical protein